MRELRTLDKVVGSKKCLSCGNPTVVEGESIESARLGLGRASYCIHRLATWVEEEHSHQRCMGQEFGPGSYNIIMKQIHL